MRRNGPSLVLVIVLPTSVMLACSGSEPGVGESFAAQATATCETALAAKAGWSPFPVEGFRPSDPEPSAFPEVAAWLRGEVAPTFEAWRDDLEALGEPPSGRDAWSDVLAAVRTVVRLNDEQVHAAEASDTEGFVDAANGLEQVQSDLEQATEAAGVPTCADVHA